MLRGPVLQSYFNSELIRSYLTVIRELDHRGMSVPWHIREAIPDDVVRDLDHVLIGSLLMKGLGYHLEAHRRSSPSCNFYVQSLPFSLITLLDFCLYVIGNL